MHRDSPRVWDDSTLDAFFHLLEGACLDLAHPLTRDAEFLAKLFKGHRLFGETARHEDAPLAVATQITDFCMMIPLQANASLVGRTSTCGTVDIRRAEGAAQRIDATKINPCCRPGNRDSNRAPESACPAYRAHLQ
jgi:hypothetical protein